MNWKLIFRLSLFGLMMAFATVYWIPSKTEPLFWLVIFIVCAYMIAKQCNSNYFLHGFLVCLVNCVWITSVHILLHDVYMTNHPDMAEMSAKMPMPEHPILMMLIMGPIAGAVSGIILGVFAWVASRLVKKAG